VARVLASMSEAQRVGQLFSVGLADDALGPAEIDGIRRYHFGSFWFAQTTSEGVAGVRRVSDAIQSLATRANTAGVGFYVAANQEGGLVQGLQGPGFSAIPTALDQGRLSPAALERDAESWGEELRRAGVNLDFAPVLDVVPAQTASQNRPIGALEREYGNDPATVAAHGAAFVRGMARAGIATTAKHFPGLGRVLGNTDFTANVVDSVTASDDPYLDSFRWAVDAGVPMVMVALATYTRIDLDHLAAFSPVVMRILRQDEGFGGVILSDDIGSAAAVAGIAPVTRAIDFLDAGGDVIVSRPVAVADEMAAAVRARAASDPAFRRTVNEAATRVLRAKRASGLLPCAG
jgi:beta-N-acetylhexosaminidase